MGATKIALTTLSAFSLGFLVAWLLYGRTTELDKAMQTFYGPGSQFDLGAVTVVQISSGHPDKAVVFNCRAMRTALISLEISKDPAAVGAKRKPAHLVKQRRCPES